MFDPKAFLETTTTEANDTKLVPVPVGEYTAIVSKVDARTWQSRDGTKSGLSLDLTWDIDDQGVKQLLGRDTVTVRQGIMLDLTDSGGLDMGKGKNISLGRVRDALGLNQPGQAFSPLQLQGRGPAKVKVEHRVDGENIYAEVKQVAKI